MCLCTFQSIYVAVRGLLLGVSSSIHVFEACSVLSLTHSILQTRQSTRLHAILMCLPPSHLKNTVVADACHSAQLIYMSSGDQSHVVRLAQLACLSHHIEQHTFDFKINDLGSLSIIQHLVGFDSFIYQIHYIIQVKYFSFLYKVIYFSKEFFSQIFLSWLQLPLTALPVPLTQINSSSFSLKKSTGLLGILTKYGIQVTKILGIYCHIHAGQDNLIEEKRSSKAGKRVRQPLIL